MPPLAVGVAGPQHGPQLLHHQQHLQQQHQRHHQHSRCAQHQQQQPLPHQQHCQHHQFHQHHLEQQQLLLQQQQQLLHDQQQLLQQQQQQLDELKRQQKLQQQQQLRLQRNVDSAKLSPLRVVQPVTPSRVSASPTPSAAADGAGRATTPTTPSKKSTGVLHKSYSTSSTWFTTKPTTRRNSSFHSCDELDSVGTVSAVTTPTGTARRRKRSPFSPSASSMSMFGVGSSPSSLAAAEKKVVASLKYLCACTGATLRNLSKKTKDLHARNYHQQVKPTWRLWGEEHEKNAVFTVYLKKVRYHRPTPTASNDSDDEISHLEWETVRVRFVKAATLARLVEALATDDGELESTFINVFLSTYRTFSTPKEVLALLTRRYDALHDKHLQEVEEHQTRGDEEYDLQASIHEQHKKTLVSALHVWLDGFPEDWHEEQLRQILAFASKRLPRSELHLKVLHRLERILRQQMYGPDSSNPHVPPWLVSSASASALIGIGGSGGGGGVGGLGIPALSLGVGLTNVGGVGGLLAQHYNAELAEQFAGLCLAPAFRGQQPHFLHAFRFPHVPVRHFAEQLTRMDSELFKRLIPHQCLGATWARRDKSGSETVVATINQFNAVLFRVISCILIEPRLKPQERALNIATWIDIAQELRLLKNFSSLKAIISGLQSNPIYRLSKIWAVLPKEKMEVFSELARIFSEDNNAWAQRELLMREGTAKFADTAGEHDRHMQKIIQKQSTQTSHGTIPYLGTFLTDLTMIHAAIPDETGEEQLINFDKKRKEFEVLAQIKLLQGAANTYNLRDDPHFDRWFASMPVLDEREAHTLSCQLESPPPAPRKSVTNSSGNASMLQTSIATPSHNGGCAGGHRKTDSIASNSSSGAGSQFYCEINNTNSLGSHCSGSSRHNSLDRDAQLMNASMMSASSSVSNLSLDSSNSGGHKASSNSNNNNNNNSANGKMPHSHSTNGVMRAASGGITDLNGSPLINAQLVQPAGAKSGSSSAVGGYRGGAPDFYIIRVTYETENVELDGIVLYKSIMLGNNERTPQVIRNAMMKLGLEADPERYTLAQVLPDKELVMPRNANVYYAVNTNFNLNFILRPRKDDSAKGERS